MRVPCPTCNRLGRVPKAFPAGTVMSYCGPNGESWPHETCQSCMGSGWVNDSQPVKTDVQVQLQNFGIQTGGSDAAGETMKTLKWYWKNDKKALLIALLCLLP